MRHRFAVILLVAIFLVLCWAAPCRSGAASVTPEMAIAACHAAAPAVNLTKDAAAVPLAVVNTLRLPLGVAEVALSPFPGPSFSGGVRHVGAGLKGPFDLITSLVRLPVSAVQAASGIGRAANVAQPYCTAW